MDLQTVINLGAGFALSVMGWFARELWGAVKALREDLSKLREEIAKDYVTRVDFRDAVKEMKELLIAIDTKLDRKADK
jgi:hypothetical protein